MHLKNSIASLALTGFFAASTVMGQAPAGGQAQPNQAPTAPKTCMALVDVGYILKNHPNMNAKIEGIKAEMTAAQEEIETRRKALLADSEMIGKTYEADSPQFKQKQEALLNQESKLRVDFMSKEKEFAEKQATVIYSSYQSINNAVKAVAEWKQIDVVLRYSREQNEMDPKKPQTVNFGIQRDVVYQNAGLDITEVVLGMLNRDEPRVTVPGAAPTGAGTGARQAAPVSPMQRR